MVTPSLTATVVCAATLALLAAGMNPYLHNARSDHCFPLDTPHSVICFPTRCTHLFINATHPQGADLLDPVPRAGDPAQVYGAFKCNVTTWYEYGKAIPQRACLRPVCSCGPGYAGGSCYPTEYNSCDRHVCSKL
uniref:EGF-like domain-containing protein n=1 Tax=Neobodo designis TaxID=312471 RepID=A0A7S1W8W3_NEODS|mmetsp:Transcript_7561/g.23595  ORF Transcript_7561/g.23595 Transcript_7561/m.23595 type:complete len:135 (+) Transcript_7561:34-438(+)